MHHPKQLLSYFEFGPVVQEMSFTDISNLELWQPLSSWSRIICAVLEGGIIRQQFCEIILNLGQWFRRYHKEFLSGAVVALLFSGAEPFMQF